MQTVQSSLAVAEDSSGQFKYSRDVNLLPAKI